MTVIPLLVAIAAATPAPSQLAVAHADDDGATSAIAVLDEDGGRRHWVTAPSRSRADSAPAWSPDGRRIVFVRTTNRWRSFHLWTVAAAGGAPRRITSGRYDETPSWSPDGSRIAYRSLPRIVTRGCSRGAIFVVRPSGGKPRRVPGTNGAGHPSWSPDGRRLAYERDGWIYISRTDGRERRRLIRGSEPAWAPTGRRIAFIRGTGLRREVSVLQLAGASRRVTRNRFFESSPAWSPDGARLAYDSVRGNDHGTYVADLATGAERRVLGMARTPDWRPAP